MEALALASDAIRDATNDAVRQIEQFAEAQATWLEQVSLKDRASFLEEQKALHDAWKTEVELPIRGQNTALRQVVVPADNTVPDPRHTAPSAVASIFRAPVARTWRRPIRS